MNKFYVQIDKALQSYENNKPYHPYKIEWITDRIAWCWKWRKITKEQMEELCDRMMKVFERN